MQAKPEQIQAPTSTAPAQTKWNCPMCTFENEPNDDKCDMCQSDRPQPSEPVSVPQSEAEESKGSAAAVENRQSNRQSLQIIDTTE